MSLAPTATDGTSSETPWQMFEEVLGRTLMLLWLVYAIWVQFAGLMHVGSSGEGPAMLVVEYARAAAMLVFSLLAASFTLTRRPAKAVAAGIEPRISALLGSYLILLMPLMPPADIGLFWSYVGLGFMVVGLIASGYALSFLGRSYSIMASARKLVTAGPYGIVRHPLYACEIVLMTGVMILNFSAWSVLVEILAVLFLWRRMVNEERILAQVFPEYAEYARHVPRVIPRLGGRWAADVKAAE